LKRRVLSILLSFVLIFGIFAPSALADTNPLLNSNNLTSSGIDVKSIVESLDQDTLKELQKQILQATLEKSSQERNKVAEAKSKRSELGELPTPADGEITYSDVVLNKGYKDDETVRVIVELADDSIATYSKKQNKQIDALSHNEKEKISKNIELQQNNVLKNIQMKKIAFNKRHNYKTVLNGFSGEVKVKDIPKISSLPGVKKVRIVNQYQLDMTTAVDSTHAPTVWNELGLKGEGMVVAIVDTGIDYRHQDMKITDLSKAKLSKSDAEAKIAEVGVGKWYSDKVPIGWNWADMNDEILDIGAGQSMHGMHVAGIVAANGKIKGVAPEAQLIAEKVFSNNPDFPSAFADDIAAAIDHAVAVGADVINMSLGSVAGFALPDDPEHVAIKNATDAGVIVVVSAGNSSYSTSGYYYPYATDPDIGTVGSPGLWEDTLQVASSDNAGITGRSFTVSPTLVNFPRIVYNPGSPDDHAPLDPADVLSGSKELVDVGLGTPQEIAGKDLSGKVALISRGSISFRDKTINAQAAGAVGVIIYNNAPGTISMSLGSGTTIPSVSILQSAGLELQSLLKSGQTVTVTFDGEVTSNFLGRPPGDNVSSFSSWGLTPDFNFKPEIMAPGGGIYSTLNKDQYGLMSGTSMAAPHAAGGMALLAQSLKEKGLNNNDRSFVELAKIMAMNTAKIIVDSTTSKPYSPRQQGAGLFQIDQAIKTPVTVVGDHGKAGVTLKDIGNSTKFTLILTNHSDQDVTYNVMDEYGVLTDRVTQGFNLARSASLQGAVVTFSASQVTVPANSNATIEVNLLIPKNTIRNIFAEGFISFVPTDDTIPKLSVPYIGFYGKWDEPRIIDDPIYGDEHNSYYEMTALAGEINNELYFLGDGYNEDTNYISPADQNRALDSAYPVLSFLRNAAELNINLLDKNGNLLRTVAKDQYIRKNVPTSSNGMQTYTLRENWAWDGKVFNPSTGAMDFAPDGQYYLEFKTRIDDPSANWQSVRMGIRVDNTPPTLTLNDGYADGRFATKVEDHKVTFAWTGNDNPGGSGILGYIVLYGRLLGNTLADTEVVEVDQTEVTLPVKYPRSFYSLVAVDNAYNMSKISDNLYFVYDDDLAGKYGPVIHVNTPEVGAILDNTTVEVSGTVDYNETIGNPELKVNGVSVRTIPMGTSGVRRFTTEVELVDGKNIINFEAYDERFNEDNPDTYEYRSTYALPVYVDTISPEIKVNYNGFTAFTYDGKNYLSVVSDVYESGLGYTFKINGNVVSAKEFDDYKSGYYETVTDSVYLYGGEQKILLEVEDLAGHTDSKLFTINTVDQSVDVYDENGTKVATIPIVEDTVEALSADRESFELGVGEQAQINLTAHFTHGAQLNVTKMAIYNSSDENIATIDDGLITGIAEGEATITATYGGQDTGINVKVTEAKVKTLTASESSITIAKGLNKQIKIYAEYTNGEIEDVTDKATYISSNPSVASVDNKGVISGVNVGKTSITVAYGDAVMAIIVSVVPPSVTDLHVDPNPVKLKVGESAALKITATFSDNTTADVTADSTYSGFDNNVISVTNGVIKGLKEGQTTIKVSYGGKNQTVQVTVERDNSIPPVDPTPDPTPNPTPSPTPSPTPNPVPPSTTTPPTTGVNVGVGTVTTTKNADGTTSATLGITSNAVNNQLQDQKATTVTLNLSDVKFADYKEVAVTLDKSTADKLLASSKGITFTAGGFEITIPADALADFISGSGFKIILSVSEAGSGTVQVQTVEKTSIVSPVVTVQSTTGKLNKPIKITLKPTAKLVADARKVGAYEKTEDGKWVYVGANSVRKDGNIELTASRLGSYAAIEYRVTFADIENHWAKDEIEVIAAQHVTTGKSETQFAPNDTITRAEFMALLDRILGAEKEWSQYAAMKGATDVLGREEMVVLMVNALDVDLSGVKTQLSFKDQEKISADARAAVAFAVNNGLIKGVDGNKFAPEQSSSRSQVAVILYRLMQFMDKI